MAKPAYPKWSEIKTQLKQLDADALRDILHELFRLSEQNRTFFAARFVEADEERLLAPYRKRIEEQFRLRTSDWHVKLDLAEARKAIREYRKVTDDPYGTAELMLTYVESGTRHVTQFGEDESRVYNSLVSTLAEFVDLLKTRDGHRMYPIFRERLLAVADLADGTGYGYGDSVNDLMHELESLDQE